MSDGTNVNGMSAENWKQNLQKHTATEIELNSLGQKVTALTVRVPEKLSEKLLEMKMLLDQVARDIKELKEDFNKDYVSRAEFGILKVEHDQMKKLMWGFIVLVLTAVVSAILALIFKG